MRRGTHAPVCVGALGTVTLLAVAILIEGRRPTPGENLWIYMLVGLVVASVVCATVAQISRDPGRRLMVAFFAGFSAVLFTLAVMVVNYLVSKNDEWQFQTVTPTYAVLAEVGYMIGLAALMAMTYVCSGAACQISLDVEAQFDPDAETQLDPDAEAQLDSDAEASAA